MTTTPAPALGIVDDDDDAFDGTAGAPGQPSELDLIAAELAEELPAEPITLAVPGRPGWEVRFSTDVSAPALAAWQTRSKDPSWPDGVDQLKLAGIVIANQALDVIRNGKPTGYTFRDKRFISALGAIQARDAVRKVYGGRDSAIVQTAERVLVAAGHLGAVTESEAEDPTPRR